MEDRAEVSQNKTKYVNCHSPPALGVILVIWKLWWIDVKSWIKGVAPDMTPFLRVVLVSFRSIHRWPLNKLHYLARWLQDLADHPIKPMISTTVVDKTVRFSTFRYALLRKLTKLKVRIVIFCQGQFIFHVSCKI